MIVLDATDGHVVACSGNWGSRERVERVLGRLQGARRRAPAAGHEGRAPGADAGHSAVRALDLQALTDGEAPAAVGAVTLDGRLLDVTAHRSGPLVVIELEPACAEDGTQAPIYTLARRLLPRLQSAASVDEVTALAAAEMKALTGFGRSLVYRFDAGGHGEVLSEVADPGYDRYAGHWFPAADMQAPAREPQHLNHIRLIPDANYVPVPLHCVDPAWQPRSLDLSFAALRSVSPPHLEYMRSMRTQASMSVSLVVRGRLWGMISCHDHAPRHLPFEVRAACEHLGRLVSLQVEAKEDNAEVARRLQLRQLTLEIVARLAGDATLHHLVRDSGPILQVAQAGGAAVVLNDDCWTVGGTPAPAQVHALVRWMRQKGQELYCSDHLADEWPEAADCLDVAAGVLAISISQVHRHYVVWFRPELVQTIRWAGNPDTRDGGSDGRLHHRRSFAIWREQISGRSMPWEAGTVAAVRELRQALIGIVLRRAEEMAEVATELGRVNRELEAFSYTVSHDLRAPMRHIAGYVDLVLDMEGRGLSERAQRYLAHVKEASAFAGHLVDALLDFSRMGRSALKRTQVDLRVLVGDLMDEVRQLEPARHIEWQVHARLPDVWADALLLQVAVRNLITNAVKYTRGREPASIRVTPVADGRGTGLEVADNGVGFQMKYVGKLFGVFQRLHQAEEFEGTGIGLANVRRIVERHGGTVWAHGEPDKGARFGFAIPRPATP